MKKIILLLLVSLVGYAPTVEAQQKIKNKDNTVTFYFTRHGKTMLNTLNKVQGWADSPLTDEGVIVAEYLAKGLKAEGITFDATYSSDLGRARQTAHIVLDGLGQNNISLVETPELRETNYGSYEGGFGDKMGHDAALYLGYTSGDKLMVDLMKNPALLAKMMDAFKALETMGVGEGYNDVKTRGQKKIREIAEIEAAKGGGNILVVGHGMSLGVFLSDIDASGRTPDKGHMGNAAVSKVTYKDGKFTLETFGDMSYIDKGKALAK